MILFYTDLLAELWALDYHSSVPDERVPDFLAPTQRRLPPMYLPAVEERSNTRLWSGPQHRGFQVAAANPESAALLTRWDNHFDDVDATSRSTSSSTRS